MPAIFSMVLSLAVLGLLVWVVTTWVPMPEAFRRLIVAIAVIVALVWILRWAGVL